MIARLGVLVKRWALPLISVIGTGLVGAVCIALMTSGRVSFVSADVAARLAIFIAFQVLGVTIAKAGLDSYVFAQAALAQGCALYNLLPIFKTTLLRIWIAFSIGSYFFLGSPLEVLICSFSVLCDVYAAVRTAELTARKRFNVVFVANLLKFPLYFLLLFISGQFFVIGYTDLLYLFLCISLLRFVFLYLVSARSVFLVIPACSFGLLGVQQVFNYLLFRLDQVCIPLLSDLIPALDSAALSDFVNLTKYPELVSYFATAFGSIAFPKLIYRWSASSVDNRSERILINVLLVFLCGCGLLAYLYIIRGDIDIGLLFTPLVISACLSFEVNFVTFRMLAANSLKHLLMALGVAVLFGVIFSVLAKINQSVIMVYWIIPVQMVMFLVASWRAR